MDYYGAISPEFSRRSFNLIAEALGAIKEIKIRRNDDQVYLDLFDPLAKRYCDAQVKIQLFSTIPGGIVEVVAFGGILAHLIAVDAIFRISAGDSIARDVRPCPATHLACCPAGLPTNRPDSFFPALPPSHL